MFNKLLSAMQKCKTKTDCIKLVEIFAEKHIDNLRNARIDIETIYKYARNLTSGDCSNIEYDRAMLELCADCAGYCQDEYHIVANLLGYSQKYFKKMYQLK